MLFIDKYDAPPQTNEQQTNKQQQNPDIK